MDDPRLSQAVRTFLWMRRVTDAQDHGGPDRPADRSPLPTVDAVAAGWHAQTQRLLDLTIETLEWSGTAATAGCTVEDYLRFEAGLPRWLAEQLTSTARRLPALPRVADLFDAGVLSFDQLAGFVRATNAANGELLHRLDEEGASLAEQLAEEGRIHQWVHEVEFLVEDLRAPGWRDRQERRLERGERVVAQQDFDGGGFVGKYFGPYGFAAEMSSMDAEVDPEEVAELGIQRARARASVRIAEAHLAGGLGSGRPARPTVVWHVDLADATVDRFAQQVRAIGGGQRMVPISLRLLTTLGEHADHVIQLQQGRRPLDELAVATDEVPARVRRAVLRRDRGCRFPDCGRPRIHAHHIVPRAGGGPHTVDNLVGLCSFHHLRYVHRLGWAIHLDPDSGLVTWTNSRTGTEIGTMPIGARPPPLRDVDLLPAWAAPPCAPPPTDAELPCPALVPATWTCPPEDLDGVRD